MRFLLIGILSFFIACNTITDQGFTNKAEARNLLINGVKEGKWMLYTDSLGHIKGDSNSDFYTLGIFKNDSLYGMVRSYYKDGKLYAEGLYTNGKRNGVAKAYYESGKLKSECPFIDGKAQGMVKEYRTYPY